MASLWENKSVLVTGATGLLGSWMTKWLIDEKADVTCLVRDWVPQSEVISSGLLASKAKIVRGDVSDEKLLLRIIGENEIEVVFHLAAQTIVRVANKNPISTFETNIKGTWVLLEACRQCNVRSVVIASSDKAYGHQKQMPYCEDAPLAGKHPYDVSKSCADLIAQTYAETYDLPVAITRCGNLYGGGDLNWNRIVPGTIRSIMLGETPIIRSDGTMIRDYFYVEDAVIAYAKLAMSLIQNPDLKGEAFNFSNEQPLSVIDIVNKILLTMKSELKPEVLGQARHEIQDQWLSSQKARQVLGWLPIYNIETGLKTTIDWYSKHL